MLKKLVVLVTLCLLSTIASAENYNYSGTRHTTHQRIGNQIYSDSQYSGTWRKIEPYRSPWSTAATNILHVLDGVLDGELKAQQAQANYAMGYQMARTELLLKQIIALQELQMRNANVQRQNPTTTGTVQHVNYAEPVDQSWAASKPKLVNTIKPRLTHNCNIGCVDLHSTTLKTADAERSLPDRKVRFKSTKTLDVRHEFPTPGDKAAAHIILGAAGGILLYGIISAMQ